MNYNLSVIAGTLLSDPKPKPADENFGEPYVAGRLSVSTRVYRGGSWDTETTIVAFAIPKKRGDAFARFHKEGDAAHLTGELFDYVGSKGAEKGLRVRDWTFTGKGGGGESSTSRAERSPSAPHIDSTPF